MKKKYLFCALLFFLLCACQSTVRVHRNGVTYQLDPSAHTITQGETVYRYEVEPIYRDNPMLKEKRVTITYPDGSSFAATYSVQEPVNMAPIVSVGNAAWSSGYDPDRYIDGTELIYIACDKSSTAVFSLLLQFLLLAVLAAAVVYLNLRWYSSIHKWHKAYREQEKKK